MNWLGLKGLIDEGKVDTQRPQTYTIAFKNQQCGCVNNVLALFDTTTRPSDMTWRTWNELYFIAKLRNETNLKIWIWNMWIGC